MTFSFDNIRNLFTDQRSEPVQPSFTPASGEEIGPIRSHSSEVLLDKAVEMNASIQQEPPKQNEEELDEAEGRYLLESYLEKRYLPELSSDEEEPSEQSYSTRELRQAANLVARDIAELQAQHPT